MKGLILKSTGSWYEVLTDNDQRINCRVRGKIRLEGIKETNPVAVGDFVEFETEKDVGNITKILPRTNYIVRQSVKKTGHAHVIAANIDQALLIVTLAYPRTSTGFIDRFLVTAESFRIPQIIIFNKRDLLSDHEKGIVKNLISVYENLGILCFQLSTLEDSLDPIRNLLEDKKTLIAGHSGVGKSTFINRLSPAIRQEIGNISNFSEKGMHTTTFAEMFQLSNNTFIIDTPGIKEIGLLDMEPEEISDYFPEMRELRLECKFGARCLHLREPKCAVLEAVKNGIISPTRYDSYVSMVLNEDTRK